MLQHLFPLVVSVAIELISIRVYKQITPAQIRDAEKNLKMMESMIEAMTPGLLFSLLLLRCFICELAYFPCASSFFV